MERWSFLIAISVALAASPGPDALTQDFQTPQAAADPGVPATATPVPRGIPTPVGSTPIKDNSFLIEEAYNQEEGVVQHISNWMRDRATNDWIYTFTQEWPIGSQTHQFS